MAQVSVKIGGRNYPLSCRDGEEAHLRELAAHLDARAGELGGTLGTLGEGRLLLMAGLLVVDELFEARRGQPAAAAAPRDLAALEALTARAEALADALDAAPGPA